MWVSAWVSTPRVTSAAGSGRVGRATVFLLAGGDRWHAPARRRTTPRWGLWARLLSGHFVGPVVPRTPAPHGRQIQCKAQGRWIHESDRRSGRLDHHPRSGTRLSTIHQPASFTYDRPCHEATKASDHAWNAAA